MSIEEVILVNWRHGHSRNIKIFLFLLLNFTNHIYTFQACVPVYLSSKHLKPLLLRNLHEPRTEMNNSSSSYKSRLNTAFIRNTLMPICENRKRNRKTCWKITSDNHPFPFISLRINCDYASTKLNLSSSNENGLYNKYNFHCNDMDIDDIMQHLVSPAPESFNTINASVTRLQRAMLKNGKDNHNELNQIWLDIQALSTFLLKPGYHIHVKISKLTPDLDPELQHFTSSKNHNCLIIWKVVSNLDGFMNEETPNHDTLHYSLSSKGSIDCGDFIFSSEPSRKQKYHYLTSLDLAHAALDMATFASETNELVDKELLAEIVSQTEIRLQLTNGTDLRGRTSADAAFCFALAGVTSPQLYDKLADIALKEMQRLGNRSSFKPKYILHIVEKFAASGVVANGVSSSPLTSNTVKSLYRIAGEYLRKKGFSNSDLLHDLSTGNFCLHNDRPLLWIWRFSTRQRKIAARTSSLVGTNNRKLQEEKTQICWGDIFSDPTKPIVLDIGCGMGISLLGLALSHTAHASIIQNELLMGKECLAGKKDAHRYLRDEDKNNPLQEKIDWSECNYAGTDLSQLFVGYANGIASRLVNNEGSVDEAKKIHFFNLPAEIFVEIVESSYPGKVALAMIQFPTPYRLLSSAAQSIENSNGTDIYNEQFSSGNSQLPSTALSGFMVTEELLKALYSTLRINGGCGYLLLQTKCEDVGVYMKKLATSKTDFVCFPCSDPVRCVDEVYQSRGGKAMFPRRVQDWLEDNESTGALERADGPCWSSISFLPKRGATETEVACTLDGGMIHRCMLQPNILK